MTRHQFVLSFWFVARLYLTTSWPLAVVCNSGGPPSRPTMVMRAQAFAGVEVKVRMGVRMGDAVAVVRRAGRRKDILTVGCLFG